MNMSYQIGHSNTSKYDVKGIYMAIKIYIKFQPYSKRENGTLSLLYTLPWLMIYKIFLRKSSSINKLL